MNAPAKTPEHIVVPLAEYVRLRRPHEEKAMCSWVRDCRLGNIPGAFRYTPKGGWFVRLDIHDEEVRKLTAPRSPAPAPQVDEIQVMLDRMGITKDDIRLALGAGKA